MKRKVKNKSKVKPLESSGSALENIKKGIGVNLFLEIRLLQHNVLNSGRILLWLMHTQRALQHCVSLLTRWRTKLVSAAYLTQRLIHHLRVFPSVIYYSTYSVFFRSARYWQRDIENSR